MVPGSTMVPMGCFFLESRLKPNPDFNTVSDHVLVAKSPVVGLCTVFAFAEANVFRCCSSFRFSLVSPC